MKSFRLVFLFTLFVPSIVLAVGTGGVTPVDAIDTLTKLIDKYESRIAALEAENAVMRAQLEKAGIIKPAPVQTGVSASPVLVTPALTATSSSVPVTDSTLQKGFIDRIRKEWSAIQGAYALPTDTRLGGYEFVQSGSLDYVFVDIASTTWTDGSLYDYKILYQFDLTTFQRKLIGFFELEPTLGKYMTKKGTNPFAGVPRIFVREGGSMAAATTPSVAPGANTGSTSTPTPSTPAVTTPTPAPATSTSTSTDIETAYKEKRYLSVISLSNTYLASNPATVDILRMRYRTFFIIGKYNESLAEIKKIQTLQGGNLDRTIACDAQVIATYSKDQTLIATYTKMCKG